MCATAALFSFKSYCNFNDARPPPLADRNLLLSYYEAPTCEISLNNVHVISAKQGSG